MRLRLGVDPPPAGAPPENCRRNLASRRMSRKSGWKPNRGAFPTVVAWLEDAFPDGVERIAGAALLASAAEWAEAKGLPVPGKLTWSCALQALPSRVKRKRTGPCAIYRLRPMAGLAESCEGRELLSLAGIEPRSPAPAEPGPVPMPLIAGFNC